MWVAQSGHWQQEPFLRYVEDPKGAQLGLRAVRMIITGESQFWVVGRKKLGQEFLAALSSCCTCGSAPAALLES